MGDDFITVHNPLAHPLPDDFLNFGQQWKAEIRGNEVTVFSNNDYDAIRGIDKSDIE